MGAGRCMCKQPAGPCRSAASGNHPKPAPRLLWLAVAETMVQMECDYVTPSFFRELEKEYQSGLRRCALLPAV